MLYNFIYTGCPEPCNNLNLTMREIQSRINEIDLGDIPVKFVTISFDPKNDTPEVLAAYAAAQEADPDNWYFATSDDPVILKTIIGGGFEAYYQQKEDGTFTFYCATQCSTGPAGRLRIDASICSMPACAHAWPPAS